MSIELRWQDHGSGPACRQVLSALPGWFGIPEAVSDYVRTADRSLTLLAEEAESTMVVGVLTLLHHSADAAEIYVMGVLPSYHRQGIGRCMVAAVEQRLGEQDITFLQVKTLSAQHPDEGYAATRAFYAGLGFVALEEFPDLWGESSPALQMVKRVDGPSGSSVDLPAAVTSERRPNPRRDGPRDSELAVRAYRDAGDLRLMQDELVRGFEHTETRIGDLAWRARSRTHYERSLEINLWFDQDQLVGWTWLRTKGGLDVYVVAEHRDDHAVWRGMLDGADAMVEARRRAGDELKEIYTWFGDEVDQVGSLLLSRGFELDEPGDVLHAELSQVTSLVLPDGYWLAGVTDDGDVEGRVEMHRAAFAPSDLTLADYRRVRGTWPYRGTLDRIVKTADGQIVAGCTAWLDQQNHSGLIEPVGTHPEFQNLGLGRAVVTDALCALRHAGARTAQIGTSGPAARAAYLAAGFRAWKVEHNFRKPLNT